VYEKRCYSRKRQRRATGNEDINQLCWDWFQEATSRRINISGPLIQEQALTRVLHVLQVIYYSQNVK
jgi:hypothetical protein